MLRLELHKASAYAVVKLSLGLRPRCTVCFSRCSSRCPILNCFNLGRVNMKSLAIKKAFALYWRNSFVDLLRLASVVEFALSFKWFHGLFLVLVNMKSLAIKKVSNKLHDTDLEITLRELGI
nr:hypothetical protein [Tanacetum cinerariifolium]